MRTVDIAVGAFFAAFGAFGIWQSTRYTFLDGVPGPAFLPMILSVAIVGLGLLLIVHRALGSAEEAGTFHPPTRNQIARVAAVAAVVAFVILIFPVAGFVPSLMMLNALLLLGVERMRTVGAAVTIVLVPVSAYWLFGVALGIRLPQGPLGY
jgi:hypothetical protein